MIIIPAIDLQSGKVVRLTKGDYAAKTIYSSDPVSVAQGFERMGAKYLHVVDLDGAKNGNTENRETIRRIRERITIPMQVGGGIRTTETVSLYLDTLAIDRIILGTVAVKNPAFVREMLRRYSPAQIVVGVDVRDGKVSTSGWLEDSGLDYLRFIEELRDLGVCIIILTDIARDGTLTAPNWEMYRNVADIQGIDLIVSGGIANESHLKQVAAEGHYGVIVGKAYYERKVDLVACLKNASSPV